MTSNRRTAVWIRGSKLARRVGLPEEAQKWLYSLVILLLLSLLALIYLGQTGHVARGMDEMRALEQRLVLLKRENSDLRVRLARSQEWSTLRLRAEALGLTPPEHVEYVDVPLTAPVVDARARAVTSPLATLHTPTGRWGAWWASFTAQMSAWCRGREAVLPRAASMHEETP